MNCWHCNTELIWGGDHDIEAENEDSDKDKERIKKISRDYIKERDDKKK